MGDVGRSFPTEIPQMPFDGQGREAVEQDLGRLGSFLALSQLRERGRPDREHLKVIGVRYRTSRAQDSEASYCPKR